MPLLAGVPFSLQKSRNSSRLAPYRRGARYWVAFYLNGELVRRSLRTDDERAAKTRLKQIEYELARGEYDPPTRLPLPEMT